jgi:hypothetical protein
LEKEKKYSYWKGEEKKVGEMKRLEEARRRRIKESFLIFYYVYIV